jgi:enamine deaminase RidA (YjgF/YER057c/UK114 family)
MTLTRVPSPSPFAPAIGFSAAVRAGDFVFVAGTTALAGDGTIVDGARAQARETLRKVVAALEEAGATAAEVVRTRTYLADAGDWEAVGRAHGEAFGEALPASTMLVARFLDPRMLVEIEAVAYVRPGP